MPLQYRLRLLPVLLPTGNEGLSGVCERALEESLLSANCTDEGEIVACRFLHPLGSGSARVSIEECSPPGTYDYFSGSRASFALTFLAAFLAVCGEHSVN